MDYISLLKIFGLIGETVITAYENPVAALASAPAKVGDGAEHAKKFAESLCSEQNKLNRCIQQRIVADCGQMSQDAAKEYRKKIKQILQSIKQIHLGDYLDISKREEVIESLIGSGTFDDETAYEKCRELLEWTLNEIKINLSKLAPEDEVSLRTYSNTEMICQWIKQNANPLQSSCVEETPKSAITDHNPLFLDKFKKHLFLYDEDSEDEETEEARLYQVFIKPQIVESKYDIITFLNRWLSGSNKKPRVFYGKPGVGKSTLTAFLVAVSERDADFWATLSPEEQTACDSLADHLAGRLHTLVLNQHVQTIDCDDAWRSVKQCFGDLDDAAYDNKTLILDGLDEVCVLKQNFDGNMFLKHLSSVLTGFNFNHNVKILITSRSGYFEPLNHTDYLIERTIYWTSEEMQEWCRKYTQARMDLQENCACILREYNDLEVDDDRRDIFCVPIILYMCCHEGVRISEHSSVVGIYSAVFDKICKEKAYQRTPELDTFNEIQYRISWQFTKELAYQMHLHDKLEAAIGSDLVKNAMNRTKVILCERYPDDTNLQQALKQVDCGQYFDKHFCIMHFQSGDTKHGAEFAHKTVGEYFTAVKLYEDYFECIKDPETTTEQVWKNIFEAFRYQDISNDIMDFFVELTKKGLGDSPQKLFHHYYQGMEKQMPWIVLNTSMVEEYGFNIKNVLLPEQLNVSFRKIVYLLTTMGFDNSMSNTKVNRLFGLILKYRNGVGGSFSLKCIKWKFINADLVGTYLTNANLIHANLIGADLSHSNLSIAYLGRANLSGACLVGANLSRAFLNDSKLNAACLNSAILFRANLRNADLTGADLTDADLSGADLNDANLTNTIMTKSDYNKLPSYVHKKYVYDTYTNQLFPK